jgi:hypothetical protein
MFGPKLEALAKELAEDWANKSNEDEGHCGPYGTDTWKDHIDEVREHIKSILDAHKEDENA